MAKQSLITAYAFSINYILGIGILSLPVAMNAGGVILSTIFFFFVAWMSSVFMLALTEVTGRGREYKKWLKYGKLSDVETLAATDDVSQEKRGSTDNTLEPSSHTSSQNCLLSDQESSGYDLESKPTFHFSDTEVLEVTGLVRLFCGGVGEIIYFIAVSVFIFCGLWNSACIFTQSIVLAVPMVGMTEAGMCHWTNGDHPGSWSPECENAYYIYGCIYLVVVSVMCCFEMSEQRIIQMSLTVARFVIISIMCITCIIAMYVSPFSDTSDVPESPYYADFKLADFGGFGVLVTNALFAFLTHHSTPGLLALLGKENSHKSGILFNSVFFTIAVIYSALSICASMYFGTDVNPVVTTMWYDYNGYDFKGGDRPWWAWLIAYLVLLFPPIDLLSVYPLNAITIGNSILMFVEHKITRHREKKELPPPDMSKRYIRILFRMIMCVFPVLLSLFFRDIQVIIKLCGLLAFIIMFFAPTITLLRSRKICFNIWGEDSKNTPYNTWMTNKWLVLVLCAVGCAAFVYTIVTFCIDGL